MLGDTLTITIGGSGGTARVCSKINQDSYSAEYLNRTSTDEVRVRVRHLAESTNGGKKPPMDRHSFDVTQTVFAVGDVPAKTRQAYIVTRQSPSDDANLAVDLTQGLTFWATEANLIKLAGWES